MCCQAATLRLSRVPALALLWTADGWLGGRSQAAASLGMLSGVGANDILFGLRVIQELSGRPQNTTFETNPRVSLRRTCLSLRQ